LRALALQRNQVQAPTLLLGISTGWFAIATAMTSFRILTFQSRGFDLGYFTQALGGLWFEGWDAETAMTGWGFFDDHFSPLGALLAPLASMPFGSIWLTTMQNLAVAVSIILVWKLVAARSASKKWAWQVTLMYLVSPPLLYAIWYDFHPSVLAIPFFALLFRGLEQRAALMVWVGTLGASLAREDMAIVVAGLLLLRTSKVAPPTRFAVVVPAGAIFASSLAIERTWFLESGFRYLSDGDLVSAILTALGNAWGGGLLLVLLIASVLPWSAAGVKPNRDFLVLAVLILPLLLSSNVGPKYPEFHYYAVVPVFFAASAASQQPPARTNHFFMSVLVITFLSGPFGFSVFGRMNPSAVAVVRTGIETWPAVQASHHMLACMSESGRSWSGPDPLIAPAGAAAVATMLPLPFADFSPWDLSPPLVTASEIDVEPQVVFEAGDSWIQPGRVVVGNALNVLGYEEKLVIGDDFLRVWISDGEAVQSDTVDCL